MTNKIIISKLKGKKSKVRQTVLSDSYIEKILQDSPNGPSSKEQVINELLQKELERLKALPEVIDCRICTTDKVPKTREFRQAWTDDNPTDTVDIDMSEAREIHKDRVRRLREDAFKELDAEFMRAMETLDEKKIKEIKLKKQELRDITECDEIEKCNCPNKLSDAGIDKICSLVPAVQKKWTKEKLNRLRNKRND